MKTLYLSRVIVGMNEYVKIPHSTPSTIFVKAWTYVKCEKERNPQNLRNNFFIMPLQRDGSRNETWDLPHKLSFLLVWHEHFYKCAILGSHYNFTIAVV